MNDDDEIRKIWKSSSNVEEVKFEKSRLILDLQFSMDTFDRKIKQRDFIEIVASLIVIALFVRGAFIFPDLITKLASILMAIWALYAIIKLRQSSNLKPSEYHENYLTFLGENKKYLEVQKKLIDSVFWWYLAPCFFCIALFIMGNIVDSEMTNWMILVVVVLFAFIVFLFHKIFAMNRRASKEEYESRISKIEDLLRVVNRVDL